MGRSPASCHTYYYKHRKLPGPAPVEGWPTTLGPRARRLVQGTGEGSLDLIRAAVAAHTVRGAVAWDAAAAQLDVPLVDAVRLAAALQAYDPDAVPGAERVFPDAWPPAERRRMAEFVAKHFGTGAVDWAVIAAYMGADVGSCVAAHVAANCTGGALRRHGRVGWTASQLQRLAEANADRARFPTMRAIAAYVGGHSAASCSSQWRAIRLGGVHAQVEWSEAERETVRRQLRSASPAERRWRRIHALLPHRTKDQVQALMVHERLWLMNRARRAGAAGEPRTDLTAQSAAYSRWTPDEVARLRHAMATVDPADPHRRPLIGFMVGTRSVAVCMAKAQALGLYKREKQRRGVQ
ncbi:hypothetical protein IWQ57_004894 [Coemansia nantahalensis]|uniref:Uncharacterized protein n=1 Tax=Coemansia nantahalensis TaxID=2789366 RepID=A0ACC1JQJ6_9FUNG|nr:hypothetical protein IWQ57_004894 [Coemansia nantahalensis]